MIFVFTFVLEFFNLPGRILLPPPREGPPPPRGLGERATAISPQRILRAFAIPGPVSLDWPPLPPHEKMKKEIVTEKS